MRIKNEHLYIGAPLSQITEHPTFRFVSVFEHNERRSKCAFRINNRVGAHIKYSITPKRKDRRYTFFFEQADLDVFGALQRECTDSFVVLVCASQMEICVLSEWELKRLIENREKTSKVIDEYYQVFVIVEANKQFYVEACVNNAADGKYLGEIRVPRKAFPEVLFQ